MKLNEIQIFLCSLNSYANNMFFTDDGDVASYDSEKFIQNLTFVEIDKPYFNKMKKIGMKFHQISFLDLYKNPKKLSYYVKKDKIVFPITSYSDFNQIFISAQNGYIFKENIRNALLKLIFELHNVEPEVYFCDTDFCFLFSVKNHIYKLEQIG